MNAPLTRNSSDAEFKEDYLLWRKQPLAERLSKYESRLTEEETKKTEAEKEIGWYSRQIKILKGVLAEK